MKVERRPLGSARTGPVLAPPRPSSVCLCLEKWACGDTNRTGSLPDGQDLMPAWWCGAGGLTGGASGGRPGPPPRS